MTNQTTAPAPIILVASGTIGRAEWRDYHVIRDNQVTIVAMTPALLGGWNYGRVTVQGSDDWSGMSAEQIANWKLANGSYDQPALSHAVRARLESF